MTTTSLELSKELYRVSNWRDTQFYYGNGVLEFGLDTAFKQYAIEQSYTGTRLPREVHL